MNRGIELYGHIHKKSDFWVEIHLPNSGQIIELMKKDIVKLPSQSPIIKLPERKEE